MNEQMRVTLLGGTELLFYVLLLAFTVHAVMLGYHWFSYGSDRKLSLLALCIYLCGGATMFLTYAAGMATL